MIEVDALRRFSRAYTQRIGLLEESYLDAGRPLGPSRLLFEIGSGTVRVLDLRRRLDLDSGYLSRLLRRLEDDGLVTVAEDPADRRQRVVALTAAGRTEWKRLDRRSDQLARRLVDPLTTQQRAELAAALTSADRLLRAATVTFDSMDPRAPDARWAMTEYFAELDARFPTGFDADAALAADPESLSPPQGLMLVVHSDLDPIGCAGLTRVDQHTAEIKRMWIHPDWRGLGLARRLIDALEQTARRQRRRRVVLDTNATLVEAIALYERLGYRSIERYNDNPYAQRWFGKDL
jgi:DNA-binding MarR family transcriptional regulator/GNAT superfamily N-acetyltransferase